MLRLFINTLPSESKCSLLKRENSMEPIQILLSEKQKTFCRFFIAFLKSTLNFEDFQKKR